MLPGNVMLGISYAIMLVPMIAEIIEAVKEKEQVNSDDEVSIGKISDLASGLFGCFNAFGNFCAPIIGGFISEKVGFRSTCDIIALSSIIYGLIYLGVNTVPYIIERRKK
jgi:MFS family permease